MKNKLLYILLLAFVMLGCDKIDGPYRENPGEILSTVTIIEFTGIGCVNCPERGHEIVHDYKEQFGDKVQAVSIHGNEFGLPIGDFFLRTEEGQAFNKELNVEGLPKGLVSSLTSEAVVVPSALAEDIAKAGSRIPELTLDVEMTINEENSTADLKIKGTFEKLISDNYGELYIVAYLMQNNIIGPQKDTRGDHVNYKHMHALRKPFNGVFGELYVKAPSGGVVVDERNYSLSLTYKDANIIFADGETIADIELEPLVFVYDNNTKELIPCTINYN